MRYIVGYDANDRGRDAIALASTLARRRDAELEIVLVMPTQTHNFDPYSPNRAYRQSLKEQAQEWLSEATELVPPDVTARTHLRFADSTAQGLIDASQELEAGLIVVGAARGSIVGRLTVGSVAGALLHAAEVPVALAPRGYPLQEGITRITCAMGERPGAEALLDVAIDSAASRRIELRLMSLVALADADPDTPRGRRARVHSAYVERARDHADGLAAKAVTSLPEGVPVTRVVAEGDSLEEAVAGTRFDRSELVLVGSSRLALGRRIFLGAAAAKILRVLPVPMVVVPRDYRAPQ